MLLLSSPQVFLTHLVATVLSAVLLCFAVYLRRAPKTLWFIFLTIIIFMYSFGYLLEAISPSLEAAYTACRVQYLGVSFLGPVFFLFSRDYFNRALRNPLQVAALLGPLPISILVMANSWPTTNLYYKTLEYSSIPAPHLSITPGPLYLPLMLSTYAFITAGVVVIFQYMLSAEKSTRLSALPFLIASMLPLLAAFLYFFKLFPIDLIPISLSVTLMILGIYIHRFRLDEWRTLARDVVLEGLSDAFILLDNNNHFLDANTKAFNYFPSMRHISRGTPIKLVDAFPVSILDANLTTDEFTLVHDNKTLYLRASSSAINSGGHQVGNCLMIYDHSEIHYLMEELNDLATHDALTGLYNRGTFFRMAGQDLNLTLRSGAPACVLMLDIDFFKLVNDHHGHKCGDEVLAEISAILVSRLRKTDIIARYGGEEICVFLPNTHLAGAIQIAETLRSAAAQAYFSHSNNSGVQFSVTLSIGVAALEHSRHKTLDTLLNEADIALYQAKTTGRNKVMAFHPQTSTPNQ